MNVPVAASCSKRVARWSLCFGIFLLFFHLSVQCAPANQSDKADDLILTLHPHGIAYDSARLLGIASAPRVFEILGDRKHEKFWVNALVVLGFLESPDLADEIIAIERQLTPPGNVYSKRALLAIPFALGSIAANPDDSVAIQHLTDSAHQALGRAERLGALSPSEGLWFETIAIGLAVSGRPAALGTLAKFKEECLDSSLSARDIAELVRSIAQAEKIGNDILMKGRSNYFSDQPYSSRLYNSGPGAPLLQYLVAARRHINATYSNEEFDADLHWATDRLSTKSVDCGGADVTCLVTFTRLSTVGPFGASGDGLNEITNEFELSEVFAVGGARVKFVDVLDYCGRYNSSTVGCAEQPGGTLIMETGFSGSALFAHEFGHNVGLGHRDSCSSNVMFSFLTAGDVVSRAECNAFGGTDVVFNADTMVRLALPTESRDRLFSGGFE